MLANSEPLCRRCHKLTSSYGTLVVSRSGRTSGGTARQKNPDQALGASDSSLPSRHPCSCLQLCRTRNSHCASVLTHRRVASVVSPK